MPQHEVAIVGKNNTKAEVTGKKELLVKISEDGALAIAAAIGVTNIDPTFMTISGVDIDTHDASVGFTSDAVEFTTTKSWAVQITDYNITPGTPTLSLEVSLDGSTWSEYKSLSTDIDITDTANRVIFDEIMPFKYLRAVYVSGGSTGDFSVKIAK